MLGALLLLGLALQVGVAEAATTGNIAGTVTDQSTGRPLAGVTVTVSGPALAAEQTEFTDASGRYIITELPPGEYIVRAYYANVKVERPNVHLNADQTLQVNAAIPTQQVKATTYRIVEKAPTVDVGNTQVQTQVTNELVRNTPVVGRTFTSVLTLAPGAANATGEGGQFSFSGATGPENNFLIDGLNTTNPSFGLVGTNLTLEFIKETEIITGGYNAEYGRATGGVVNVITKSGSNEFHGGAWFNYVPFQLAPERVGRIGEAVVTQTKTKNIFDFGFDIGGPIIKDRLWFYAGFAPIFTTTDVTKIFRSRTANNVTQTTGTYAGDTDPNQKCPEWFGDKSLCASGGFITQDLPENYWKRYERSLKQYNWIAKLNLQLNENNALTLQYIGTPNTFDGALGTISGNDSQIPRSNTTWVHDVVLRYVSKLLDRKLQVDIMLGYHREDFKSEAGTQAGKDLPTVIDTRTMSLADYQPELMPCARQRVGMNQMVNFNPCPQTNYRSGGAGLLTDSTDQRIVAMAGLTYFARLAGTHAIKLGGDFEMNQYRNLRFYTGGVNGGRYRIFDAGGGVLDIEHIQYGTVDKNAMGQEITRLQPTGFNPTTQTLNESLYLRDSWNVGFLPGLTINAGLRWEAQQVKGSAGDTVIGIYDNIAPRVGFIYDFTRKGYSKIYASYGRFYESIPLDINDRQFSGEGLAIQDVFTARSGVMAPGGDGCPGGVGTINLANNVPIAGTLDPTKCTIAPTAPRAVLNGGEYGKVSPVLKGQYSNEIVAGLQYDVGLDLVLGAAYVHRDLGRIIEDISPDGGNSYIVANPGDPTDEGTVKSLQEEITKLNQEIATTTDPTKKNELIAKKNERSETLALYKGVAEFEKPKRDYNALVLTATKRFSHNFTLLASYTYSRTVGNYPGLFQASNGQLDPNISSQYDLKELVINRNGPLPNDRPHNFKLTGAYAIPLGQGSLTLGMTFTALSGRPIEVLGSHPLYGANETFVLQRGSGGRTPTVTQLDLRVGYERQFSKLLRVGIGVDVFNVLNQRQVTGVDDAFTNDRVLPIQNGTYADLDHLKTTSGTEARKNTNYGQPTAFQAPLSMRLGIRVTF